MSEVYLNGEFIDSGQARISVFDQGLLYGDGIFESFRSIAGRIYQFDQHYRRLCQSAEALAYTAIPQQQELEEILLELQRRNAIDSGYFRITITRGTGEIGFQRAMAGELTCLVIGREFSGFDERFYSDGIALGVARTRRNAPEAINPKIKSISNLNSLLGKLEAKQAGHLEVIMLNNKGHICEGAASNIFWARDQWIFTPSPATGLLEGVTRSTLIRLCGERLKRRVIQGEYKLQDLLCSDEVFITSTSLEAMPVVQVGDFVINGGRVGPIARKLRGELRHDMERRE